MTQYLSKDAILQAHDVLIEDVEVPEWGGTVRVRGLSGLERDALEESTIEGRGKNRRVSLMNFRAKLVVRSVVDESGRRVFDDADVAALGRKSAAALNRVVEVAQRLAGITEEDVEELTQDFESAPTSDSGTD